MDYRPNMALEDSYDNWIMRYDLHCASSSKIGMIGSSFFLGWVLTLMILPRISDIYGRQKLIICGNLISLLVFIVLLISRRYEVLIGCMIIFGMMSTIRI